MSKVLVVEDSSFQRKSILKVLDEVGLEYETANNGLEAFERLQKVHDFDFVMSDLLMPELDGIGLVKKLKEIDFNKPIIVLTANIQKPVINELKELGVNQILNKPFEVDELKDCISNILGKNNE